MRQPKSLKEKQDKLAKFLGDEPEQEKPTATPSPANTPAKQKRKPKQKKATWEQDLDDTKKTEQNVNVLLSEFYREVGLELAELLPEYHNRKHMLQVIIKKGIDQLIAEQS